LRELTAQRSPAPSAKFWGRSRKEKEKGRREKGKEGDKCGRWEGEGKRREGIEEREGGKGCYRSFTRPLVW